MQRRQCLPECTCYILNEDNKWNSGCKTIITVGSPR